MTQPTATEKCKQASKDQGRLHPENLHMEIWISLLNFADICACVCMFVLVRERKEAKQSNLAVTTAVDLILFHLMLPGGEPIPGM